MFFYFRDFFGCGVRPAAHLSLSSLASSAGYEISASLASGATDRALLDSPSSVYIINSNVDHTFTYTPNTNYYITQAYTNSNSAEDVKYYRGYLLVTDNAYAISYIASDYSSKVKFIIYDLSGDLTLNLVTGNTKPILEASSGTTIDGVAIQARLSGSSETLACLGDVRINGYTSYEGLDYVHISATESWGFMFSHWEIDGTVLDSATYGISADIPLDLVKGKIITAVYTTTSNKTNTDTETDDNGGFV